MTIQNAVNQMLSSASITAGLYAQSPAGKVAAESQKLNQELKVENLKGDIKTEAAAETSKKTTKAEEKAYAEHASNVADIRKRQFELQPSEESYKQYLSAQEEAQKARALAKGKIRLEARSKNISDQKATAEALPKYRVKKKEEQKNG